MSRWSDSEMALVRYFWLSPIFVFLPLSIAVSSSSISGDWLFALFFLAGFFPEVRPNYLMWGVVDSNGRRAH